MKKQTAFNSNTDPKHPANHAIAAKLKQLRLAANKTMREVAASLDCPHSLIGKIEQCSRQVTVQEYMLITSALGLSVNDALFELETIYHK